MGCTVGAAAADYRLYCVAVLPVRSGRRTRVFLADAGPGRRGAGRDRDHLRDLRSTAEQHRAPVGSDAVDLGHRYRYRDPGAGCLTSWAPSRERSRCAADRVAARAVVRLCPRCARRMLGARRDVGCRGGVVADHRLLGNQCAHRGAGPEWARRSDHHWDQHRIPAERHAAGNRAGYGCRIQPRRRLAVLAGHRRPRGAADLPAIRRAAARGRRFRAAERAGPAGRSDRRCAHHDSAPRARASDGDQFAHRIGDVRRTDRGRHTRRSAVRGRWAGGRTAERRRCVGLAGERIPCGGDGRGGRDYCIYRDAAFAETVERGASREGALRAGDG